MLGNKPRPLKPKLGHIGSDADPVRVPSFPDQWIDSNQFKYIFGREEIVEMIFTPDLYLFSKNYYKYYFSKQ